jgi:hypothetical protein
MLPGDALGLPAVSRTTPASGAAPLGDPRQQALQRALAPHLGKSMQGEVLARLTDGSALVRVADTSARMLLPPAIASGAQVPLTLVALSPRPTFEVGTPGAGVLTYAEAALPEGADPHAAPLYTRDGDARALAGRDPLARTAQPTPLPLPGANGQQAGANAGADLSPAGRLLGSVLAAALKNENPASAVTAPAPLLPAPNPDPAALAGALERSLATSGLFYESHVAEWAGGARTLAELSSEPQQAASRAGQPPDALDPGTAGFINLQLVTHEQGRVAWQGQLWPGQPLHLQIEKDAPQHNQEGAHEEPAWQSRLRLSFPVLGMLDARLTLAGGRLNLHLSAGDAQGAALLRAHQDELAQALQAAGTPLSALAIGTERADG